MPFTLFQHLMTSENSPIIEYYPPDFKTDLNGKQQEWEAVVLIPFIDEVHAHTHPSGSNNTKKCAAVAALKNNTNDRSPPLAVRDLFLLF